MYTLEAYKTIQYFEFSETRVLDLLGIRANNENIVFKFVHKKFTAFSTIHYYTITAVYTTHHLCFLLLLFSLSVKKKIIIFKLNCGKKHKASH